MKNLLLWAVGLFFLASCEQDPGVFDYRNEYTGTYACKRYYYSQVYMQSPVYDTTDITITVTKDYSSDSKILVNGDTIEISESGTYSEGTYSQSYSVKFRNDSVFTKYSYNYLGGVGSTTIKGVKLN